MSKKLLKLLTLALLVVMMLSLFSACKTNSNKPNTDNKVDGEIEGTDQNPNLPAKDYDGHEFTFISRDKAAGNIYNIRFIEAEEESGQTLPDAVYRRNALVQEKYNIKIKHNTVADLTTEVRTQVMGGQVDFDAILGPCSVLTTMAQEGLLYNLLDIELFNWDHTYWDAKSKEQLMIGDKLYFSNCDIDIHSIGFVVYFNKKIVQDHNLTSPYEHMKNNTWTIDTWAEMVKSVSRDLNNDGVMDQFDLYGSLAEHHVPRMFLYASGVRATTNDETGYPVLTLMENADKTVTIYDKVKNALNDSANAYCMVCAPVGANGYADKYAYLQYLYTQDHYMFYQSNDLALTAFTEMESEFGIVPFPKYNEHQDTFKTIYPYNCSLLAIPNNSENLDRTARIIEDMNYYSSFTVVPAWFDTLLARRYARDDESEETLRILRQNYVYDLGLYYNFGNLRSNVMDVNFHNANIQRNYDAFKRSIEMNIKITYEKFGRA